MFFILTFSKLWLYLNKACAIFILGTIAVKSFRNLQNKYGIEKRKWKVTNRSGAGAGEVKRLHILDSLRCSNRILLNETLLKIGRPTEMRHSLNRDETLWRFTYYKVKKSFKNKQAES